MALFTLKETVLFYTNAPTTGLMFEVFSVRDRGNFVLRLSGSAFELNCITEFFFMTGQNPLS